MFHLVVLIQNILKSKRGPGASTGGPPLEAVWHPLLSWRRVLRTIFVIFMVFGKVVGIERVALIFRIWG